MPEGLLSNGCILKPSCFHYQSQRKLSSIARTHLYIPEISSTTLLSILALRLSFIMAQADNKWPKFTRKVVACALGGMAAGFAAPVVCV